MNTPKTRRLFAGIAALAGVSLLAACSAGGGEPAPQDPDASAREVTLMLNWTPNAHHAGIYYAAENGLYEAAGIDLTIIEPSADVGADVAVAEGQVEFGISQAESLLPARAEGMGVQSIAALLPVNDSALMGLEGSGLTADPGSLDGLRYGGYGGALETEIISELVSCGGGDPASVEFIDIGNVDYLAGLEQERFDVTWVFGGWDALRAQTERDDVTTIQFGDHLDCIPNWYTPIIIGNETALEGDPDLARDFLAATGEGYAAVIADPEAGAEALLAGAPELEPELVRNAVAYYAPLFTADGSAEGFGVQDEAVWTEFTEFLVQAGLLEDASPVEGAWSNEFLPQG
ncbi:ABC transporter substrate-binding protein [Leucobacter weissii]|uniref:ABC transporter substrate-binding protein n=1 Tax=Leucobacter weissii TaxID=1983706 RepID=UPI003132FE50